MAITQPRIALVQDWLNGFAGGEQVLLALHQLYPEAPIYTSVYNALKTPQFDKATVIPSYLQSIPCLKNHHQIAIPLMPAAFESFNLKEYKIIISIGGGLSKGIIAQPGQRHISYCHTPIRYIWNLGGDSRNSGRFDSKLRELAAHRLRMWDVVSAERVDQFVANSHTVAARIAKIYRQPAQVIYPPVATDRFPIIKGEGNYFLSVNRMVHYKRIDLIIEACIMTKSPLKLTGGGPELEKLKKMAAGAPWIEFLGRVPDQQLAELYGNSKAFIFAGEEDFGIVAVEAMAAGRPVIAYNKGGVTETVREGSTGTFFTEQNAASLAEKLTNFDGKNYDPHFIHQHALQFDRTVFKQKMQKLIEG